MARAVAHAGHTLGAGVTTERDLGTEGAFDADVQLRRAIAEGIVPGPRILVVTRAIVATGSYGPEPVLYAFDPPQGAEEATGATRSRGWSGVRSATAPTGSRSTPTTAWGPRGELRPTFTLEELKRGGRGGARARPAGGRARDDRGGDAAGGPGRASKRWSTATRARPRYSG